MPLHPAFVYLTDKMNASGLEMPEVCKRLGFDNEEECLKALDNLFKGNLGNRALILKLSKLFNFPVKELVKIKAEADYLEHLVIFEEHISEQEQDDIEEHLLLENIDLILSCSDYIITHKEYSRVLFHAAAIHLPEGGIQFIKFGALLQLWKNKEFNITCPKCSKKALIVGAKGYGSSGYSIWHGICLSCKQLVKGNILFQELYGKFLLPGMVKLKTVLPDKKQLGSSISTIKQKITLDKELQFLCDNFEGLMSGTFKQSYQLKIAYLGSNISGRRGISLKELLSLWKKGRFIATCSECKSVVYVVATSGSMLSGAHEWIGFCSQCKKPAYGSSGRFSDLYAPFISNYVHANEVGHNSISTG